MKIRKRYILGFLIALVIFSLIYYFYPRSGSLNYFMSSYCNEEKITKIKINHSNSESEKSITDKNEIHKILSDFYNINLMESYSPISKKEPGFYCIEIFEDSSLSLDIFIFDKKLITLYGSTGNHKNYKITDGKLDIDYLN